MMARMLKSCAEKRDPTAAFTPSPDLMDAVTVLCDASLDGALLVVESGEKGTWCGHLPDSTTAPATVSGERPRSTPLGRSAREGSEKR